MSEAGCFDTKIKKKRYCFYLNQFDVKEVNAICQKENTNKSVLFRKFIASYQYIKLIKEIEAYNQNIQELKYQIKRCGINLNQIAYNLQIDINEEETALSKTKELFKHFQTLFEEHEKLLKPIHLDLKKTQGNNNE